MTIVLIVLGLVLLIAAIAVTRRAGPRVTQIDRTVVRKEGEDA